MNKRYIPWIIIISALIALLPHSSYAQYYELRLTVRDSITNKPLDFVTATLFSNDRQGKEEVYNYALSDSLGLIKFMNLFSFCKSCRCKMVHCPAYCVADEHLYVDLKS